VTQAQMLAQVQVTNHSKSRGREYHLD